MPQPSKAERTAGLTLEEALIILVDLCLTEGIEFPPPSELAALAAQLVRLTPDAQR